MRLRWIVAALRQWAAWIDCPVPLSGVDYGRVPGSQWAGNWLPKDSRDARRTHKAVQMLSAEYFETIKLVYLDGPRANKVSIAEIARWKEINRHTLYERLCVAENKVAQELDSLREDDDAID